VPSAYPLSRRGIVVALVVSALTLSLATRVFHGSISHKTQVSASSDYQKVQHRDKDGVEWKSPTADRCLLWLTEASVPTELQDAVHVRPHYDSLYNRPPPVA